MSSGSLPGGAAPSAGLPGGRGPPPFAQEEPAPSAPFESGYLSLKGPEEGDDEGRGFEPEPRRSWEPDHPEAQMKVEFFRKLGYSPEEILVVLRKHGAGADTNTILGELVQHGAAAAAAAAAGDKEPGDPPAEPSPGTPRLPCGGAPPSPAEGKEAEGNLRPIVIDGSNVAMSHGERGVFSCRGILLAVRWFLDRGHTDITVFVPSWRKEQPRPDFPIADQHILQELEKRKILVFTPSRRVGGKRVVCYDDRFIVKLACESDGIVVSNDTYRDLQAERAEWKKCIEERLLMYSFVNDKFMPPDDPLGRHGPSLENFLRKKPLPPEQKSQPCPYGKKCTYGLKCKYYHPERPPHHPQRAVADELRAGARLSPTRGTTVTQEERMGWRRGFDPFTEDIIDGIVANTVKVKIISGQFLSDKRVGIYVEVDMFGLPVDTKRKYRTRTSQGNSFNPVWDEEPFVFHKVVLPTLASLRIAVFEEGGKFVGHRILPVSAIRSGYHYICLRSECNQPLCLPALLVYTEAYDYIPDDHQNYAEALINPIKHVSLLDQRAKQLAALIGESEENTEKPRGSLSRSSSSAHASPAEETHKPPPSLLSPVRSPSIIPSQGQRDDLIASILAEVTPQSVEELRQQKAFVKLLEKQYRELKELRRKHMKKIGTLNKRQNAQFTLVDRIRLRSRDGSSEAVRPGQEQDGTHAKVDLQEWQMQGLLQLRETQHQLEREKKREHLHQAQQRLREIARECQAAQLKKLKEINEKEKKELQKILDRKRHNSITEAKSRERNKKDVELTEINRRHITESVNSIRRLEEAQKRRQEKLVGGHQAILQLIDDEEPRLRDQLEREGDLEALALRQEIGRYLLEEMDAGISNGHPPGSGGLSSPAAEEELTVL